MDETTAVVIVTGPDRRQLVRDALTALGEAWTTRAKAAKRVFVHVNLVSYRRPTANTHPEAVRGVLDHLTLLRSDEVLVGDGGVRNTKRAFQKLGYETLARSGNIRLVDLNDDATVPAFAYTRKMEKRAIGFAKAVVDSDFVIVVVPAKMHSYFGVTLSIKTQVVGSLVVPATPFGAHMRWPWVLTGYGPANHTLAELWKRYPAHLAIIDGTQAMAGNGPADGETVDLGWLVASFNPVAADALAAYLMGWDPHEVGYLHHLGQWGLGPIDPVKMAIIGPAPDTLRRPLAKPSTYPGILAWREGR